ncbi:MAG: hypothetical protein ING65_00645, partial [Rhodocyclaceae bacterium]|nr:hypothetical protein [Rhodocyclaceae bacterium]
MMRLIAVLIVCLSSQSSFAATLLNSGWEYQLGEKIDSSQGWTPIEKPCLSGTTAEWAWFRTLVKSPFVPEPVLFLHMMDQPFEARIGDQTVYSFGNLNSKSRANFFGFPWHFVPLNSYSEVKEVVFKVRSNHSDHIGLCREIQVGSKSEIIKSLIRSDAKVILVSMIFLIIGLASLVASFFTRTTSPYGTFGALASLIGLWIGTTPENHVKQLILDNPTFWVHVDQISLYLIPAAFIAFLTDVFGDGIFRIEKWMKRFYLAFAVSSLIGSICGFLTLDVTHRIFNKVIPFSFAITISNSILLAIKGEKKARLLTGGILCFLMFAVHDWLVGTWVLKWHNLVMHWGFLLFICFLLAILHAHVRELLDVNTRQRLADARTHAIARTTQALAHDVRKPFSMFKSIIQVIEGTEDPNEVRKVLQLTLPEVNQAMASVEGMIQDVMQIGSDATMNLEDAAPSTLIEAALGDLFRIFPEADVSLSYDFSHRHMVRADSLRVERVFANILGNAMQAMRERGNLWIRTLERDGFIEFTLGNGGSHIPHESLPKLFDAFFTSGKKGGTGLGLAIAKKIVEAHGGAIRCVSEVSDAFPQGMVEFVFTLPAATSICAPRLEALPRTSREIQSALAAVRIVASRQEGMGADPREAEIEGVILQRIHQLSATRPQALTVLVVEDEGVYRNGLLSLLERSEDLSRHVRMVFAHNDKEALA